MPKIPNTILVDGKRIVCKIWDNEKSFDRYTIVLKAIRDNQRGRLYWPVIGANEFPFHPQGFGSVNTYEYNIGGNHLGKRIDFDSCPIDVKKLVLNVIRNK